MEWLSAEVQKGEDFNHNKLEQVQGLLVYVSRTYPAMNSYLKGIYLTIDQFRGGRDKDIWNLTESELEEVQNNPETQECQGSNISPSMVVRPVNRFSSDIHVLTILNKYRNPLLIPVHPKDIATALYGFVDKPGSGYGRSLQLTQTKGSNTECII